MVEVVWGEGVKEEAALVVADLQMFVTIEKERSLSVVASKSHDDLHIKLMAHQTGKQHPLYARQAADSNNRAGIAGTIELILTWWG